MIILLAIFLLFGILLWLLQSKKSDCANKVNRIFLEPEDKDEGTAFLEDGDWINEGKTDERKLEIGDSEQERPVIDFDSRQYYQNLGDKLKQDEAIELLLRATEEHQTKKMNFEKTKVGEQAKQKQADKEIQNRRMLDKLKGYRIKRKIAKKVAKKNIQLDEKMIEKIKLRALAGKMR